MIVEQFSTTETETGKVFGENLNRHNETKYLELSIGLKKSLSNKVFQTKIISASKTCLFFILSTNVVMLASHKSHQHLSQPNDFFKIN